MTTNTTMSSQLNEATLLIAALERAGWTPQMIKFVRRNRAVREQITEIVAQTMPKPKTTQPKFRVDIRDIRIDTLERIIRSELSNLPDGVDNMLGWIDLNQAAIVDAFAQLTERDGWIFVRYFGIYVGMPKQGNRNDLAREYKLSATGVKGITDRSARTVARSLYDQCHTATLPPQPPSIDDLCMSNRTAIALKRAGIYSPEVLGAKSDDDLLNITGIGNTRLREIRGQLVWYEKNKLTT